ncbi:YafY family protein [Jiulongibacter sediminis]|jgi:predicted DNA-binding transcriptional regulator YafY|uniref:helix-turn-helix transcriptional regulator n=1 Tax=Jiulongibacter sediminis TaxID=1605367 RepID=UPI0026F29EAE|nr:YafY family protein [Jiulongibacter sediminis]
MPRLDRLTSILIQLQSKRIVKAQEIADRFEISLRTVYRDIRTLEQAGVPIISEAGIGYSIMKEYRLPPVHFTEDEALSFITAGKFIERLTDQSTIEAYQSALYKIKAVLAHGQKELVDDLSERIAVLKNNYLPETRNEHLDIGLFLKAINEKRVIQIVYQTPAEEQGKNRKVEPAGIYNSGSNWYLIAFCQLRNDYRNFRIDRISSFEILTKRFTGTHPGLHDFLYQTRTERELTEVIILIDKEAYSYLGDQHYYHGFVSEKPVGSQIEMHFLCASLTGFAHWFMLLGSSADIVKPLILKEIVREKLDQVRKRLETS